MKKNYILIIIVGLLVIVAALLFIILGPIYAQEITEAQAQEAPTSTLPNSIDFAPLDLEAYPMPTPITFVTPTRTVEPPPDWCPRLVRLYYCRLDNSLTGNFECGWVEGVCWADLDDRTDYCIGPCP